MKLDRGWRAYVLSLVGCISGLLLFIVGFTSTAIPELLGKLVLLVGLLLMKGGFVCLVLLIVRDFRKWLMRR